MTLFRLVWPDAMVTEDRGTFKSFAKKSMQASLARPSTGGVVSESFSASPSSPVMAFVLARGCTFTANEIPLLLSWILIMAQLNRRLCMQDEACRWQVSTKIQFLKP